LIVKKAGGEMRLNEQLISAVDAALAGEWDRSHRIVQEFSDQASCWIHAVLHKIEGDEWNSRYWYARSRAKYEDFTDPDEELKVIRQQLETT
jgi:hypothetical protein